MARRTSSIPAGGRFLPHTSREQLKTMHRQERDPKAASRLLAYIKRKEGMSIRTICRDMNRSYSTIRDWLLRAVMAGVAFRYDEKRKGLPCRLDADQLADLCEDLVCGPQECGFRSGVWTAPLAARHVRQKYGVTYTTRGMQHLMHRIALPCRHPRPEYPKAATESEKREFKKSRGHGAASRGAGIHDPVRRRVHAYSDGTRTTGGILRART